MIEPWKKISERVDYDCGFFKVRVKESASPLTGKTHPFYILSTRDWVNVVAFNGEKKVLMVSQFRHGSGEAGLEIPGGAVDAGEDPLKAAQRELLEETGHQASRWELLGKIHPNPAILDNTCHIYLALDARAVAPLKLDEAEELEVGLWDLRDLSKMIRDGKIRHALVIAAFHLLRLFQAENPDKI